MLPPMLQLSAGRNHALCIPQLHRERQSTLDVGRLKLQHNHLTSAANGLRSSKRLSTSPAAPVFGEPRLCLSRGGHTTLHTTSATAQGHTSDKMNTGPVVLVTGCSKGGLGYHLCEEFASKGCTVYAGVRNPSSAQGLQELGVRVLELDVNDQDSRQKAVQAVLGNEGQIDILVNNAGVAGVRAALLDIPVAEMHAVYETNFFAPLALSQLVVPSMARQKQCGKIVNICSINAYASTPFVSIYGSSKAALTYVSDCLRRELRPLGIHVMHVALGAVKTSIQSKVRNSLLQDWPTHSLYLPAQANVHELYRKAHLTGSPAQACAKTIVEAALKPHPPRCLWTGSQWWVFWLLQFCPAWLLDVVSEVMFKLGRLVKKPTSSPV